MPLEESEGAFCRICENDYGTHTDDCALADWQKLKGETPE
jgi:hypothetical protein